GRQATARSYLPGLPAALPADHDDHDGGVAGRIAARAGNRHRVGVAPPTRYRDRRRSAGEPGPHALHDARDFPDLRPHCGAVREVAGKGCRSGNRASSSHMSISELFIRKPVATTLLTIALALAGGIAFRLLPVSPLPQVEFPTIQVQANLPGASPETMASSVATPLERQFGRIAGLTELTSTSYLGASAIVLQFDLNRDINAAARDVQAAINAAAGQLPSNLPSKPTYKKVNPADAPILILALTSDAVRPGLMYDAA